jgi:hypothetical protein
VPRSQQVPPPKPKLISQSKPEGSFWERLLGIAKGPITNAPGSRGHMGDKPTQPQAKYKDAAKRRLGQSQKDF